MFTGERSAQSFPANSSWRGRDFPTAAANSTPGYAGGRGVDAPPGLPHAGKNAMLPTKTSFEDVGAPTAHRGGYY